MDTFKQYLKEDQPSYRFGCIMAAFNDHTNTVIKELQERIPESFLYRDGDMDAIEPDLHVTIKYGLNIKDFDGFPVNIPFKILRPFDVKITDISYFEQEEFDVLKLAVEPSKILVSLREYIEERWTWEDKYPVYEPHITLAYVKKGMAEKYINEIAAHHPMPSYAKVNRFIASLPDKVKLHIPLT